MPLAVAHLHPTYMVPLSYQSQHHKPHQLTVESSHTLPCAVTFPLKIFPSHLDLDPHVISLRGSFGPTLSTSRTASRPVQPLCTEGSRSWQTDHATPFINTINLSILVTFSRCHNHLPKFANVAYPTCLWRPVIIGPIVISPSSLASEKKDSLHLSCGVVCAKFCCFDRLRIITWQTNGQT